MPTFTTTRPVPKDFDPPVLRDVLAKQKRKEKPERITVDGFPVFADDPSRENHLQLDEYLREVQRRGNSFLLKPSQQTADQPILKTPIEQWPGHLRAILVRVLFFWTHGVQVSEVAGTIKGWRYGEGTEKRYGLRALAPALLRREPPLSEEDLIDIFEGMLISGQVGPDVREHIGIDPMLRAVQRYLGANAMSPALRNVLTKLRDDYKPQHSYTSRESHERVVLLDDLLGDAPAERSLLLEEGEPWAEAVLKYLGDKKKAAAWEPLLKHAAADVGSKPTGKWIKEAKKLVDAAGAEEFAARVAEWLPQANTPRTVPLREGQILKTWQLECDLFSEKNESVLKGLAWACAAAGEPTLAGPLGALAEGCYKKIPNVGPRSPLVGNACLIALTMLPGREPQAELTRLKAKVKQPTARKMIEKAIGKSAEAAGLTPDDLEEQAFGTYGLSEVGHGERKIGSFTVETRITGTTKVEQTFIDAKGKSRASVPAELKDQHADAVAEVQKSAKDLTKMLPAFRDRLERLPISRRELPLGAWRQRYLDQPVLGTMARRLIWEFVIDPKKTAAGMFLNGKVVDATGKPLAKMDEEKTIVCLWHPSTASVKEVENWRNFLQKHEITQPFKQAYREVYLLTDAERQTATYSNRFAAHILRQHIFAALCTQRGWKYKLMGTWDGGGDTTPTLAIPRWDMRVEYWLAGGEVDHGGLGTGVASHVFTDQVRFYSPAGAPDPMPLTEVPPLAFSEVMRDVDLFVGVASIGNDPNWIDAGDQVGNYWHQYSFGDLSNSAKTRRAVLERLIPRLKIADRCSFHDKFLVVRGDIRTYRIHLGSSNIQMEPNNQYLCIVADRSASARTRTADVFLPFEGDQTLSIIISKAFMLADDTAITDPTIIRQIKP